MTFDLDIAARTVWMESRSEPVAGQRAVAWVIANRHKTARWYSGHTLAECCLMAQQFSCWNTNDPNRISMSRLDDDDPTLLSMRSYVIDAMAGTGTDPTFGATHYYASGIPTPPWAKDAAPTVQIGRHRFFNHVN